MSNSNASRPAGRESICEQCGTVYRAKRSTSRFCSNACRCKAKRGTGPTGGPKGGPVSFSVIGKALLRLGFAGPIGPASTRSPEPAVYALTVPPSHALDELQLIFDRKGWGHVSLAEFREALSVDGIRGYSTDSPEAIDRKRLQARQRVATARLAKAA